MKETVTTKEICDALSMSRKSVLDMAKKGGWLCARSEGRGKGVLFIKRNLPADVRFALSLKERKTETRMVSETKDAHSLFLNSSEKSQRTAQDRASLIAEFNKSGMGASEFVDCYNGGMWPLLLERCGKMSKSLFYSIWSEWKKKGIDGLVPKYSKDKGGAGASMTEEEKRLLKHFWLKNTQPTMMHAYRLMKENVPYSTCTYETARRFLLSIPKMTSGYFRLGAGRFENLFLPYVEQDIRRYRSLEVVVSDHHCLDCVVLYNGELVRPWVTTFQDLRSGKVLGWCPSVKPSSLSIIVAYYMCCIRHGIP